MNISHHHHHRQLFSVIQLKKKKKCESKTIARIELCFNVKSLWFLIIINKINNNLNISINRNEIELLSSMRYTVEFNNNLHHIWMNVYTQYTVCHGMNVSDAINIVTQCIWSEFHYRSSRLVTIKTIFSAENIEC